MADESPSLKQGDIEELLRQAQMASGLVPDAAASQPSGAIPSNTAAAALQSSAAEAVAAETAAATATLESPRPASASSTRPGQNIGDDVQFLLAQAEQAIASVEQPSESTLAGLAPFELKDLAGAPASGDKATLEL